VICAHVERLIDFATFDPWDNWNVKQLRFVIDYLERRHLQQIRDIDFRYYTTLAASPFVSEESGRHCVSQSAEARNLLVQAHKPWMRADQGKQTATTAVQSIAELHKTLFGSPGEPRYEAMIEELKAAVKRTPAEIARLTLQREAAAKRAELQKAHS